ncbi:hypothetical protein DESA109040_14160 [Deinococcus saxicola]|uniref:hypothetical protein n=1 Tax=Deinococcus saxicola TaxID=249406 RepID=UPI0039EE964D
MKANNPEIGCPPPHPAGTYPQQTDSSSLKLWWPILSGQAQPGPWQVYLLHLLARALDDGLFYSDEIKARLSRELGTGSADNGDFGMDMYQAREFLTRQRAWVVNELAAQRLKLAPGSFLGTLDWHDRKRTTSCEVIEVRGNHLTLQGNRGRATARVTYSAARLEELLRDQPQKSPPAARMQAQALF